MQVLCGQCGQTIKIEDEEVGTDVLCPKCQHEISVPRFDEIPEDVDDLDDSVYDLENEEEGFADQVKQAMSRKVQVVCGSCNRGLSVSSRLAGRNARCPACGVKIRIPYPDEEADEIERDKQTASQTEQTEQLDLSGPEAEFARSEVVQTHQGLRRPEPRKNAKAFWVGLAAVAVGAVVVGIWVSSLILGEDAPAPGPDDPSSVAGGGGGGPSLAPPGPGPKAPGPKTPGPKVPGPKPPVSKPAPAAKGPTIALVRERADTFAANGYFPAAPDKMYWHMTARIEAGATPLEMNTYGPDVTLTVAGRPIPSAGLVPGPLDPPMRGKRTRLIVPALASREVSFVFEVPAAARRGTLKVGASAGMDVDLSPPAMPTTAAKLAGTYVEAPPRNLKPMLRDPVMRAIQDAGDQTLVLAANGDDLAVTIPQANVTGMAKATGGGLYAVTLTHGGKALGCTLRMMSGLGTAILYLKDAPFHQITYMRSGLTARPRPAAVVTAPKPVVPPAPVPKPVTPPPTPVRPDPAPPKTRPGSKLPRDHGRPTIFD